MNINPFGKTFKNILLSLMAIELLSLISFIITGFSVYAFWIVVILSLTLTLYKIEYGLFILLTELFVGGHGYLFFYNFNGTKISIRLVLFLIIISVWFAKKIKNLDFSLKIDKKNIIIYSSLFLFITIGIINGLINNETSNVFFDFNAWIYFALLPIFFELIKKVPNSTIQILTGATTYLSLKTLGSLFLFSHSITGIGGIFYKWIRNTGVGEITYISGTLFRIFFQSQLYCLIGFFIILALLIANFKIKNWINYLPHAIYIYLVSLTIYISQSRSFWVGGLAGLFFIIILSFWKLKIKIRYIAILIFLILIMFIDQSFLIKIITNDFSGNLVSQRFKGLQTEAAGMSRINQLNPLTYNILQQTVFGYGFGKTLTYQSTDPRIVQTHPNGIYTTYAFEWGYLDIWLKIGLLGLISYLALIAYLYFSGIKKISPLHIGLLAGLTALVFTNIFSPYLNHPLGIGYIMLISGFLTI